MIGEPADIEEKTDKDRDSGQDKEKHQLSMDRKWMRQCRVHDDGDGWLP